MILYSIIQTKTNKIASRIIQTMYQNFNANQQFKEVLILKNGKQNDYSTLVERFLEKHVNLQEMQIRPDSFQQIRQNCLNKTLVIFLCQVSDRIEMVEAEIIPQLEDLLEKRLVFIHISPIKLPAPHFVANKAIQLNVNLQKKDEKLVKETLKECLNLNSVNEGTKAIPILAFISTLLFVVALYLYFQCDSMGVQIKSLKSENMVLQNNMTELSHNYTILLEKYQDLQKSFEQKDGEFENERDSPLKLQWNFLIFFAPILIMKILEKWLLPGVKMLFRKSKSSNEQEEIDILDGRCIDDNSIQVETEEEAESLMDPGSNLREGGRSRNENFSTKSSVQEVEPEEAEKSIEDNSMDSSFSIQK